MAFGLTVSQTASWFAAGEHKLETVANVLQSIRPEADFSSSSNFISDGLLDSFDIVTLVSELDRTFNVSIPGIEIVPENFSSIPAIEILLQKHLPQ